MPLGDYKIHDVMNLELYYQQSKNYPSGPILSPPHECHHTHTHDNKNLKAKKKVLVILEIPLSKFPGEFMSALG